VDALRGYLMSQSDIADKFELMEQMDKRISGNFEIYVLETHEILHSARRGQGRAESLEARKAIADHIRELVL